MGELSVFFCVIDVLKQFLEVATSVVKWVLVMSILDSVKENINLTR